MSQKSGAKRQRVHWRHRLALWLRHHRNENRRAWRELKNNKAGSLMTILVLAVALSLPAGLQVLIDNSARLTGDLHDRIRISIFLKAGASAEQVQRLANVLRQTYRPEALRLVSPEEGLAILERRAGLGNALQYLDENPLPWVIEMTPGVAHQEANTAAQLQADVSKLPLVDVVKVDLAWLRRLAALLNVGERILTALALIFAMTVILVVGNTIRLAVENHRAEIEVVKLVGATDAFIRRPFLYLGAWYGALGGVVAWLVVQANTWYLGDAVRVLARQYGMTFDVAGLSPIQATLLVVFGTFLGWLGAWLSVSRRIRTIEPA